MCRLSHAVRGHDGHADGPLCHHVPAGQPVAGLPVVQLPVPAQHVCGHRQPLAAPAQVGHAHSTSPGVFLHCAVSTFTAVKNDISSSMKKAKRHTKI